MCQALPAWQAFWAWPGLLERLVLCVECLGAARRACQAAPEVCQGACQACEAAPPAWQVPCLALSALCLAFEVFRAPRILKLWVPAHLVLLRALLALSVLGHLPQGQQDLHATA